MGCCTVELSVTNLILLGGLIFAVKKLASFFKAWKIEKMLEKWSSRCPRDTVLLHSTSRCKTVPTISSYALKLETYLRMAKIPYELESTDPKGPKDKIPWISYNGMHVADSHLCIQFLNKKLEINLNKNFPPEVVATARACRIMLEEHFFWGAIQFRFFEDPSAIHQLIKLPKMIKTLLPLMLWQLKRRMISNGMGRHSRTEVYQMTEDDLRTASSILGNKNFFGGEEPCEEDAAIFGWIAQVLYAMPGSNYERLAHGELKNLKDYSERMKTRYWPDWDSCLDRF